MVYKYDYYNTFIKLMGYSCTACQLLIDTMLDFHPKDIQKKLVDMEKIVQESEKEELLLAQNLAKDFITPIEKEDIIEIVYKIRNITGNIKVGLYTIYMYNVTFIHSEALRIIKSIEQCNITLRKALIELHNFRKSKALSKYLTKLRYLEDKGERLYVEAVRKIYLGDMNHKDILAWTQVFNTLERSLSAHREISDVLDRIIIKNY